jgi:hypothetical protein
MNDQEIRDVVHKFRDEPAADLLFQPSIEYFMDSEYCKSLDRVIHKPGTKWERLVATETLASQIPEKSGIYMFVWRPEFAIQFEQGKVEKFLWVMYVGKAGVEEGTTSTLRQRYLSEYSKYVGRDPSCLWETSEAKERKDRLARFLTLRPLDYWYLTVDNIHDVANYEKKLIRLLNPPLNRHHGKTLRTGKTKPAFEEIK